jgi:hypothetical protein
MPVAAGSVHAAADRASLSIRYQNTEKHVLPCGVNGVIKQ